jgi:hypothetical protein
MNYTLKIIDKPPTNWLLAYEPGMVVWLVKEKRYAVVCSKFNDDGINNIYYSGQLDIDNIGNYWFVSRNGYDPNGYLLMFPVDYDNLIIFDTIT